MKTLFPFYKLEQYLNIIVPKLKDNLIKGNKGVQFFNVPVSFDIETSSFISDGEKVAIMYEWSFSVFNYVIIGRKWNEYEKLLSILCTKLELNMEKQLIIYVHNLGYEFQFFRKHFKWEKVFAIKERTPIYAIDYRGICYKCSYILSGYSLQKVGENLQRHKVRKLVGDLNYNLVRHSETPLTVHEIMYCVNDVLVVCAYIQEEIENCGGIDRIPLTQTGYVRNYVKGKVLYNYKHGKRFYSSYTKKIHQLKMNEKEYAMLKLAFQGGYTHASHEKVGKILKDVTSFDFTSSYPSVMLDEMYPMSPGIEVEIKSFSQLKKYLEFYCCVFVVTFYNLDVKVKYSYEHYISSSRCFDFKNMLYENGRVYYAEKLTTVITNIDFSIIEKVYKWEHMKIGKFYAYFKDYLPKEFLECIIHFYKSKNLLKHVKGKEVEYMKSKQMLNSTYGMCVTDVVKDIFGYTENWFKDTTDLSEGIDKYNRKHDRVLFYPWGVFVTAYARRNLWLGIMNVGEDYIYSDTDSIKILNGEKHKKFIDEYNKNVRDKLKYALHKRQLDFNDVCINGKLIGAWDYDGHYDEFKTLGAKRYLVRQGENYSLTVAGLGKKAGINYLLSKYGKNCFNHFTNNLYVPKGETGKNTHTYIDDEKKGILVDYKNKYYEYDELSSIHLSPADFTLNMTKNYLDYLFKGIHNDNFRQEKE